MNIEKNYSLKFLIFYANLKKARDENDNGDPDESMFFQY